MPQKGDLRLPDNHRADKRKPFEYWAHIMVHGRAPVACMIENISASGAKLRMMGHATWVPDAFVLQLTPAVQRRCQVVWRSAGHVGVQFDRPRRRRF